MNSILLLSEVFQISLDKFIKGDIEKLRKDSYRTIILLLIVIVLIIPLAVLFHWYGIAVSVFLAIVTLFYALRVAKYEQKYNIQTFKGILALLEKNSNQINDQ